MDEASGVALGHRRLSVLYLSPVDAKPMAGASGRFVISYNGEVHHHRELRAELENKGRRFRGHSDIETILEACSESGVEATTRRPWIRGRRCNNLSFLLVQNIRQAKTMMLASYLFVVLTIYGLGSFRLVPRAELGVRLAFGVVATSFSRPSLRRLFFKGTEGCRDKWASH